MRVGGGEGASPESISIFPVTKGLNRKANFFDSPQEKTTVLIYMLVRKYVNFIFFNHNYY